MRSLDIVVVTWNSAKDIGSCLESVFDTELTNATLGSVVVVDNGSADETVAIAQRYASYGPVMVVENKANFGFARACNVGARASNSDYILFLNPDARLLKDSLSAPLVAFAEPAMKHVAVFGVQLVDEHGRLTHSVARFPTLGSFLSRALGLSSTFPRTFPPSLLPPGTPAVSGYVDQIIGAFFLVRRSAFESLHGFDERYFLYYEELDLSLRLQQAGWKSYFFRDVQAIHKGGGSSSQIKARKLCLSLESRLLYCFKNFSLAGALSVLVITLLVEPLTRLVSVTVRLNGQAARDVLSAYLAFLRRLPYTIKKMHSA